MTERLQVRWVVAPAEDHRVDVIDLLRAGDLKPRTVLKILVLLRSVLDRARRRGWIDHNPAADVRSVRTTRSGDFNVLDPGEVALLAGHAANAQDAALYTVAAFTGLRLGELLALRWGDVDFAKRIVHVRRSYVLGREDTPKSHKVRSVPLIDQAAVALDGLSRREHFTDDDDRVFVNDVGEVLGQDLLRRRFKRSTLRGSRPCACTTCATRSARWPCRRSRCPTCRRTWATPTSRPR